MSARAGWEGLLDAGETILWQGRPAQGFYLRPDKAVTAVFGLAFAGFALFWMTMAAQGGGSFWVFGLIHFTVGAGIAFSALFGPTLRLRATWYTLTDRRAFIGTDLPFRGRQLESYPIRPDTPLELRAGPPDTIHFAREERRGTKGRRYMVDIGFERIEDGAGVMRLMRGTQAPAAAGPSGAVPA